MPLISATYGNALMWAEELHLDQRRKGKSVPYISLLIAVSGLVREDGGTEDQAIAGPSYADTPWPATPAACPSTPPFTVTRS